MPDVTILTDPIFWGTNVTEEAARCAARFVRKFFQVAPDFLNDTKYRGHFAVTRSLVDGCKDIGVSFNYNPKFYWELADTVIVLAGVRTLRQAIELKRHGRIKKIYAGPNIVVFSSDHNSIIASNYIDAVIAPSDWVVDMYLEDNPKLNGKIFSWPAGVNTEYWKFYQKCNRERILIFDKQEKPDGHSRIKSYKHYLESLGWKVDILSRNNSQGYTPMQYLEMLQACCLMVGFTVGSESQGLAWAEAWSVDVPTLILRNTSNVYRNRRYSCSTAPYLTDMNGLFFDDLEDFKNKFHYWESNRSQFMPRAWVIENMSDKVCARQLYKKVTKC